MAALDGLAGYVPRSLASFDRVIDAIQRAGDQVDLRAALADLSVLFNRNERPEAAATLIGTSHDDKWAMGLPVARNHLGEILGEEGFATCVAAGAAIEFPTAAARYAREQIALAMSRRAIESAGKIGSVLARTLAYSSHGTACTLGQDWQGARDSLAFALELGRVHQAARFMDAYYVAALAEAQLGLGDALAMREAAGQAVEMARRMRVPVAETPAQRLPKAAKRYS